MPHKTELHPDVIDRILKRRGKMHVHDTIDARRTALVSIDMQVAFLGEGLPSEVPMARAIVPNINKLATALRSAGGVTGLFVWRWLTTLAVFVLLRTEPVKRFTRKIWSDHFKSVLYFSCIAFGLVHVSNFTSITVANLLLAPLLVLPQVISGFIFAFARMRLGMIWCILLHTMHNALLFFMSPMSPRW